MRNTRTWPAHIRLLTASCALGLLMIGCPPAADDDDDTVPGDDDDTSSTVDADGDGFSPAEGDCDDTDPDVNPLAVEVCDGKDNDCNDAVDEGFDEDADGTSTCGADGIEGTADDDCDDADPELNQADADGDGSSTCDGDCDDGDAAVNPAATEVCDGVDNDCDGTADDVDADGDGAVAEDCGGDDCDDANADVWPGAAEVCDGVDNDCDGEVDDIDVDGDGYLDADCGGDDCDDADATIHPGAEEVCDDADTDCDGVNPDHDDGDLDGFTLCDGDCDDADAAVNPGVDEVFGNGVDDDCDGRIDVVYDHSSMLEDCTAIHGDGTDPSLAAPTVSDMDGDGTGDLIFAGMDDDAPLEPVTYLFLGRDPWAADVDHTMADGSIDGEVDTDVFSCSGVGDVDGDGFGDAFCFVGDDLCLYLGAPAPWPAGTTYQDFDACIAADPADVGYELHGVAGIGDVNDDGFDDVAFYYGDVAQVLVDGALTDIDRTLSLRIHFGRSTWTSAYVTASDADIDTDLGSRYLARFSVADVDADGFDDILICAGSLDLGTASETHLMYGDVGTWTAGMTVSGDAVFRGTLTDGSGFYECARVVGDLDGDGENDLHFEAYDDGDRFLFGTGSRWSGPQMMSAYDFELTLPDLQSKLAYASFLDLNGDGLRDVALGSAWDYQYTGYTHVFLGRSGLAGSALWTTAGIRFTGPAELPWGGAYAYGVGDVTGDGIADLIIGSTYTWSDSTAYWYLAPGYSGPDPALTDDDGDGFTEVDGDCDDSDPNRYPGAAEPYDFTDWDCDGVIYDPGVVYMQPSPELTFTGSSITGSFTWVFMDGDQNVICEQELEAAGTATSGSYGNECPDCTEQWDLTYTDNGATTCTFDPSVFGVEEISNDEFASLWVSDTVPYGYCVADDCSYFSPYSFDDYLDYWVTNASPAIWVWGPDLAGVGHPEFLGYLEPVGGANAGLPASGDYTMYFLWIWYA